MTVGNRSLFAAIFLERNFKEVQKSIAMSKKKPFALRVNEDMMKAIEKWAADEFRSTNGQIEWMLMQCLKEHNRNPK